MAEKCPSPKTIANVHGLLSAAMTTAVRLGYRADNPCVGVELPKSVATRDEMTVLTRDEFGLLLSRVSGFYQPLVLTLVATGPRWGEATALTAGDVDLSARPATVRVTKAWKRDADRHWYVGPPKTKRARRTVSLPDDLVDVLLPLVAGKAPDELLFTNTVGSQLSSSRSWTTTWTPALNAACNPALADGSPDPDAPRLTKRPRVHDLRHTHASWMIAAGTDLFVLQRRLGHESITTTTETYAHLMPDQQRAAADAASRSLCGLVPGPDRRTRGGRGLMNEPAAFTQLARASVFATPVPALLSTRPAVVLERIARGAGTTRWYYAVTRRDLERVCERLVPGSAVSSCFDGRIGLRPWDEDTEILVLDLVTATGDTVVGRRDPTGFGITVEYVAGANERDSFAEGLAPATEVFVCPFPALDSDGVNAVTINLPDHDAVTRPHPH